MKLKKLLIIFIIAYAIVLGFKFYHYKVVNQGFSKNQIYLVNESFPDHLDQALQELKELEK